MKAIFATVLVPVLAGTALAKPPARPAATKPAVAKADQARVAEVAIAKADAAPAKVAAPVAAEPVATRPVLDTRSLADMPLELVGDTVLARGPSANAAAPAVADAPAAKQGDAVSALDLGNDFGLKKRATALPTPEIDTEQFEAKSLTENQVGDIVRERAEELEYCWLRLPAKQRVVSAAILHLEIAGSGKVTAIEVNGDMPAGVDKCITKMASRWTFPAADAPTSVDHGIMLTTASQKVR